MADDLKRQITEFMDHCHTCTIATVSADGQPSIAAMYFRNSGVDIYMNTGSTTQKVKNITANSKVAIVMHGDGPVPTSDQKIKGIQYVGIAGIVHKGDTSGVPMSVIARHNAFNSAKPGESVIIKVTPVHIFLIDYSKGFRHRELLEL